jgi:undecaprenyl pyrophosphate phosphatase UppP
MRIIIVIIAFILSLAIFSFFYKVSIILGGRIIEYFNIDTTLEFGRNMVATNTLIGFVVGLFFAIKVFKIIRVNKEKYNEI